MPDINYSYNCLMLKYNFPNWIEFIKKLIHPNDIFNTDLNEFGYEQESHITVLYGIMSNVSIDEIKKYLYPLNSYRTVLTGISIFENQDFDVVKFDIECNILHQINAKLCSKIEYTNDYPEYIPHMTIAYTLPGHGNKYTKKLSTPYILYPDQFIYSTVDGKKNYFSI